MLRSLRISDDLTQEDLARLLKCTAARISQMEAPNAKVPDRQRCFQIAEALGEDPEKFWKAVEPEFIQGQKSDFLDWHRKQLATASKAGLNDSEVTILLLLRDMGEEFQGALYQLLSALQADRCHKEHQVDNAYLNLAQSCVGDKRANGTSRSTPEEGVTHLLTLVASLSCERRAFVVGTMLRVVLDADRPRITGRIKSDLTHARRAQGKG